MLNVRDSPAPPAARDILPGDAQEESRISEHIAPPEPARFEPEAKDPFEPQLAHELGRALHLVGEEIEQRTDSSSNGAMLLAELVGDEMNEQAIMRLATGGQV